MNNKGKSTVSVAMATYNGEKYILEQLDSIVKQTVLPDEIVISDDNSTDNTVNIINEFIKSHNDYNIEYKVIINSPANSGVTSNFQNAIENTTGDIVFLSDQDDVWKNNKIERVLNAFESNRNINLVVHNAQILRQRNNGFSGENSFFYDQHSSPIRDELGEKKITILKKDKFFNYILSSNLINGMCMVAKRDFLYSILPFPKYTVHDAWIMFCAITNDSCYAINDSLALYRIHYENTIGLGAKKSVFSRIITFDEKTKQSLIERYVWSVRVKSYLHDSYEDFTEENRKYYEFISKERLSIIVKNKVQAIIELLYSYILKKYNNEGKSMLFHDIVFCLIHLKKARKDYVHSFMKTV